jgi:hypothetical protein
MLPIMAWGQVVNIESDRGGDKQGLHGSNEVGLSLQRGNVEVFQYQLGLRADYIKGLHHSLIIGSMSYGESEGEPFQDQSYAHLRWTAMWWDHVGTEVFTQVQTAEFQLLTLRQLTGCGLRFTMFNDHLAIGIGGMSDYERISTLEVGNLNARATSYIRVGKEWKNRIKGQLITYFQPLFTDPEDYRILTTGSLEFSLNKVFSLVNELNYAYDTRPPEQVINEDMQIKIKFKVRW